MDNTGIIIIISYNLWGLNISRRRVMLDNIKCFTIAARKPRHRTLRCRDLCAFIQTPNTIHRLNRNVSWKDNAIPLVAAFLATNSIGNAANPANAKSRRTSNVCSLSLSKSLYHSAMISASRTSTLLPEQSPTTPASFALNHSLLSSPRDASQRDRKRPVKFSAIFLAVFLVRVRAERIQQQTRAHSTTLRRAF